MSHIKLHGNPKTNVKAKTNPNCNLQKTRKKAWKNVKKYLRTPGVEAGSVWYNAKTVTTELPRQVTLVLIFCLLTYIAKQKMQ